MKTQKEYKADERKRKRKRGLVPKEIWIYPEKWELIKKFIEMENKR